MNSVLYPLCSFFFSVAVAFLFCFPELSFYVPSIIFARHFLSLSGGTGAVGRALVRELLQTPNCVEVHLLNRVRASSKEQEQAEARAFARGLDRDARDLDGNFIIKDSSGNGSGSSGSVGGSDNKLHIWPFDFSAEPSAAAHEQIISRIRGGSSSSSTSSSTSSSPSSSASAASAAAAAVVGFSCLGSTRAVAGSAERFREIDLNYTLNAAKTMQRAGMRRGRERKKMGTNLIGDEMR